MKKPSLKSLHAKAWKLRSEYVRKRDKGICITCGKEGNQAGHFVHKNSMDFVEENTNCQCAGCNLYGHGRLGIYAVELDKKYGRGIAANLIIEGHKVKKFTRSDYEKIIKDLEEKLSAL